MYRGFITSQSHATLIKHKELTCLLWIQKVDFLSNSIYKPTRPPLVLSTHKTSASVQTVLSKHYFNIIHQYVSIQSSGFKRVLAGVAITRSAAILCIEAIATAHQSASTTNVLLHPPWHQQPSGQCVPTHELIIHVTFIFSILFSFSSTINAHIVGNILSYIPFMG